MTNGPVVLHASRLKVVASTLGPLALVGIAARSAALGGASAGPVVLGIVGAVLLAIVLVDLPLRAEFDAEGLTRVCILRTQRLPWSTLNAVARSNDRPTLADMSRTVRGQERDTSALVVRRGARRTILLVDRCESHAEWAAIRDLVAPVVTVFAAGPPPVMHAPAGRGPRALHRAQR